MISAATRNVLTQFCYFALLSSKPVYPLRFILIFLYFFVVQFLRMQSWMIPCHLNEKIYITMTKDGIQEQILIQKKVCLHFYYNGYRVHCVYYTRIFLLGICTITRKWRESIKIHILSSLFILINSPDLFKWSIIISSFNQYMSAWN